MSKLFTSIQIKDIVIPNRIIMTPMAQYSATDSFANDWYLVHYGTRAMGRCGAIIQESTAVSPEGRTSYADLGIWKDEHIVKLKCLTTFIKKCGVVPGIQLGHSGRKASQDVGWNDSGQIKEGENSWQTIAPSAIPFREYENPPIEITEKGIEKLISDYKDAAERSIAAGYRIIEIHAAHGNLIHEFLSPVSNQRTDQYGGCFENRVRFLLKIVDAINSVITDSQSLWVRISATDWIDGGWNIESSIRLVQLLKIRGVDLIDVSTGGMSPNAKIPIAPNYQVTFASQIKRETGVLTGAVGLITQAKQAEELLVKNKCDLVFMGRELLRNPYFPIYAAKELDNENIRPNQYR